MMGQGYIEGSYEDFLQHVKNLSVQPYSLFFDSNDKGHPESRWSFLCFDPIEIIESKDGLITQNSKQLAESDPFEFVKKRLAVYTFSEDKAIPFTGGAAGYWGYDLGRQLENTPTKAIDDMALPDMAIGIYINVMAYDHKNKKAYIPNGLSFSEDIETGKFIVADINFSPNQQDENYKKNIECVIDEIHAGEVYQANLTRRFEADQPKGFSAFSHYLKLREHNPAPFSAFMNFGEFQLSCCSPERFLKSTKGKVETRPIKGTLPSNQDPNTLKNSVKDRAENIMIVDLLRNDLSKVAKNHSVKVDKLCAIESFAGLHHLVSIVNATLQKNTHALDLLKACFPGGSITGAPKRAAMDLIEALEPTRRGPYCGAMGYVSNAGDMDTNIIIRTLIYANDKIYLQSGGGIVSDSNPQSELNESLNKIEKIFESFKK